MGAGSWPKLADVRSWLRLQADANEDAVIDMARTAAIDVGVNVTAGRWPVDTVDLPDAVFLACVMHAGRLYRRRDSLDGTVGWSDMGGAIRVAWRDPDAISLYANYAPLVFG